MRIPSEEQSMPVASPVLEIEEPHYTIRLYENLLRIDLKGSFKNEIEEALENKPILKETIGGILSLFAPLHIRLSDVDSAQIDENGKVKIILPRHRDITIPLEHEDAEKLASALNHLAPLAKKSEWERIIKEKAERLEAAHLKAESLKQKSRRRPPCVYDTIPYYFPTEQVDIVGKLKVKKKKRKKQAH
jgi:hypothetical protein